MLSGLINLRLSSRKRASESLDDTSQSTPPPASAPEMESLSPRPIKSLRSSPSRKPRSRSKVRATPPPAVPDSPEKVALDALKSLVRSCPPKSFQTTILSRLEGATPEQVSALSLLLQGLEPPPKLHCARCHLDYFDEENGERSCVMDHDDNSTEVTHGDTTWGCCGTLVDGMEPPAGYCFWGPHTDDRAKARYRDDYMDDEEDDGLQSCKQKRCKHRVQDDAEARVVVTRRRGSERMPPPKKKRLS